MTSIESSVTASTTLRERLQGAARWAIATKRLPLLAALSAIVVSILCSPVRQGLQADPAWQIRAAQQFVKGESPTLNSLVTPDPRDLSKNRATWIYWWSPGTPLLAAPLLWVGLSPGDGVRLLTILCLVVGAVGWAQWIRFFTLPRLLSIALAVGLPWVRYAHNNLFLYSNDLLVFASVPWGLVTATRVSERWRSGRTLPGYFVMFLTGAVLGFPYILKYAAVLPMTGAAAYLACCVVARWMHGNAASVAEDASRGQPSLQRVEATRMILAIVALGVGFCVFVGGLTLVNRALSGTANLITARRGFGLRVVNIEALLANPALALADAQQVLAYFLQSPKHIIASETTLRLLGLPGSFVLYWLLAKRWPEQTAAQIGIIAFVATLLELLLIYSVSKSVDMDARHVAAAAFTALPLAVERGLGVWRRGGWRAQAVVVTGVLYLAIPMAYGVVSVVGKVRRDRQFVVGPSGLRNVLLANDNVPACQRDLAAVADTTNDIWYTPEAGSMMDLPGRTFIETTGFAPADFTPLEQLRNYEYHTSQPLTIHALIPPNFESDPKGSVIRASFRGAGPWTISPAPHCKFQVWTSRLSPTAG